MSRITCHCWGCYPSDATPCCERCGAGVYDPAFIEFERSRFYWPRRLWWGFKRWLRDRTRIRRCDHCRKRLWPWSESVNGSFCSMGCLDKWIPF